MSVIILSYYPWLTHGTCFPFKHGKFFEFSCCLFTTNVLLCSLSLSKPSCHWVTFYQDAQTPSLSIWKCYFLMVYKEVVSIHSWYPHLSLSFSIYLLQFLWLLLDKSASFSNLKNAEAFIFQHFFPYHLFMLNSLTGWEKTITLICGSFSGIWLQGHRVSRELEQLFLWLT